MKILLQVLGLIALILSLANTNEAFADKDLTVVVCSGSTLCGTLSAACSAPTPNCLRGGIYDLCGCQ